MSSLATLSELETSSDPLLPMTMAEKHFNIIILPYAVAVNMQIS